MKRIYLTNNSLQTKKLGEGLAKKLLKTVCGKGAIVVGLTGNLGGGKTTFLQGFAKGLGIKERILSPTFVIMKRFKIKIKDVILRGASCFAPCKGFKNFYHIDCYRLQNPKEILDLGFRALISNPQNIVAIEWAERIKKVLPRNTIWIKFEFLGKNERRIIVIE